jgi:hypothetical protein
MMIEEQSVEWMLGAGYLSTRRKPTLMPLWPPQIAHITWPVPNPSEANCLSYGTARLVVQFHLWKPRQKNTRLLRNLVGMTGRVTSWFVGRGFAAVKTSSSRLPSHKKKISRGKKRITGCKQLHCTLWYNDQTSWLRIQRSRVRFPALPDFLRSSVFGTSSIQPSEDNWGATWKKSSGSGLQNWD